jgi:hypothetical protein
VGKQSLNQWCVFFILVLLSTTLVPFASAADVTSLSLRMFGGEEQTHFDHPVLVAGVWHYLNLTISEIVDVLSVRFYKGPQLPGGEKNETNYYEWTYDTTSATIWSDVSGYGTAYIQSNFCQQTNTQYSFCIGIKDFMPNIVDYYENWTVEVTHGGTTIHSEQIVAEKPKTGVSLSKPSTIIFRVDPFTIMDAQGDNFFKIGNIGNIPLYVDFDSETHDAVEISAVNRTFLPDTTLTQYVTVHSKSWPPGFKVIDIQLNGSYPPAYFIDTNATVTLYSSFVIDVPQLIIYVGHSNYEIEEIPGTEIIFQYLEKITMYEGEIRNIPAYVSGNGAVTLELWADGKNISILKISDGTTETTSPLSFTSTNTSERMITASVKALSEGTTGILTYRVSGNGGTNTYTTRISIGPPQSPSEEDSTGPLSLMQIIIVGIVLLVLLYMILSYLRNRKR